MTTIHTTRLQIRPFQPEDAHALYDYLSNPSVYRFEPGEPITLEEAQELARARAQGTDFWAVVLVSKSIIVGHLYFNPIDPPEFLTWELGYIFNPRYQGQGYATEAARGLLTYGFKHWDIHRVVAHCDPKNVASWRVLEKIGMRREGELKQNVFFRREKDGTPIWLDSYKYAILHDEFFSL